MYWLECSSPFDPGSFIKISKIGGASKKQLPKKLKKNKTVFPSVLGALLGKSHSFQVNLRLRHWWGNRPLHRAFPRVPASRWKSATHWEYPPANRRLPLQFTSPASVRSLLHISAMYINDVSTKPSINGNVLESTKPYWVTLFPSFQENGAVWSVTQLLIAEWRKPRRSTGWYIFILAKKMFLSD